MTYATTSTTSDDTDSPGTGYQLCEFCKASGTPNTNPDSICDCTPIERLVAGPAPINDRFDTILRLAETAVIDHWAAHWDDAVTITRSVVRGQCNDEYTVQLTFDGTLTRNVDTPYETPAGSAQIIGIKGDGTVSIGVTLTEDMTGCTDS